MIQTILRALAGLTGILFLVLGLMLLFAPGSQTARFDVFPSGNAGLSTLRGDMAGFFLGAAVFALFGAIRASVRWLTVPAVFLGLVIAGRLLNLMLDGYSIDSARTLTLELVMLAILLLAIRSLRSGPVGFSSRVSIAVGALVLIVLGSALLFQRQIGMRIIQSNVERTFQNPLLASLPDGLHAGLCGAGSPLADPTRAGPCVFVIAGKHVYVIDTGDGSARRMTLMGLSPGLIDAIFITHFHSDHIGGLGEMMLQRWAAGNHSDPCPVFGPQGVESVVQGFNEAYALDKTYRVAHHGPAIVPPSGAGGVAHPFTLAKDSDASQVLLTQDGLTITAFAVNHAPVFPAAGYRFDYRGRSVVISGDTAPSPTLAKYAKGADVLFHEGFQPALVSIVHDAVARNNRPKAAKILADIPGYHTSPEDAARIAQQAGVRQLVFYHTIPALPLQYLNAAFLGDAPKIFKGPITVGKDGTMVSLPAGGTSITSRDLF